MMDEPRPNSDLALKDVYTLYESGKGRRYGLLFSVNGGAFAILSVLVKDGHNYTLTRWLAGAAAIAMIAFIWIIWKDIDEFGRKMSKLACARGDKTLYGPLGKRVLMALAMLLTLAWVGVLGVAIFAAKISH